MIVIVNQYFWYSGKYFGDNERGPGHAPITKQAE